MEPAGPLLLGGSATGVAASGPERASLVLGVLEAGAEKIVSGGRLTSAELRSERNSADLPQHVLV